MALALLFLFEICKHFQVVFVCLQVAINRVHDRRGAAPSAAGSALERNQVLQEGSLLALLLGGIELALLAGTAVRVAGVLLFGLTTFKISHLLAYLDRLSLLSTQIPAIHWPADRCCQSLMHVELR